MVNKSRFYPAKVYKWHVTPLPTFREMLLARRANKFDNIILVTGSRGLGKTTFTGKVLFGFEDFDPWKSMVYSKEEMFKLIKQKMGYVWADEGIVHAAKGNVMSRANKLLFEAATINRDNFNIIFFLMPFVEDFDSKILQYCSAWVHIDSRGLGVLMLPSDKGLFGRHNWDIVHMKRIYDEFLKESKGMRRAPYWIYDNFRGYFRFGALPKHHEEIVGEIKSLRKNQNLDKEMANEVKVQVSEMENTVKYYAKQLAEMLMKGQVRSLDSFKATCESYKMIPDQMLSKCDYILKKNGTAKTVKSLLKQYEKEDALIQF